MGERFKRAQRERFCQLQSRDFNALRTRDLFSERPELFARAFNCFAVPSAQIDPSDPLSVMKVDNSLVVVRYLTEPVGRVDDANSGSLACAVEAIGSIPVLLDEQSAFGGTFSVRLNAEEFEDGE